MSAEIWSTPCVKCDQVITEGQFVVLIKLEDGDYGTIHHTCPADAREFERALHHFDEVVRMFERKPTAPAQPSRLKRALRLLSGRSDR